MGLPVFMCSTPRRAMMSVPLATQLPSTPGRLFSWHQRSTISLSKPFGKVANGCSTTQPAISQWPEVVSLPHESSPQRRSSRRTVGRERGTEGMWVRFRCPAREVRQLSEGYARCARGIRAGSPYFAASGARPHPRHRERSDSVESGWSLLHLNAFGGVGLISRRLWAVAREPLPFFAGFFGRRRRAL